MDLFFIHLEDLPPNQTNSSCIHMNKLLDNDTMTIILLKNTCNTKWSLFKLDT